MKKRMMLVLAGLAAAAAFAQEGASMAVALGPVTATKPVLEKAAKDGNADVLDILVRGVETALTAELSNNDSPFALIGGNVGANLYKKIVLDQKSPTESDGEEEVKYGLSVEITAFADAKTGPTQSGVLTVVQREITVMASATLHDVGKMRAEIATSVTATGKRTNNIRSQNELAGVTVQNDILIGEAQKDLAKKLAEGLLKGYFDFPAYIIKVDGNEVSIDQGQAWCKVGDVLTVYGAPISGEVTTRGRVKSAKAVALPGKKAGTLTITDVFGGTSRGTFAGNGAEVDGVVYKKGR
jgi:hypothetical protein